MSISQTINIDDLVGKRYKKGGRSVSEGFDCYGLVKEVSRRFGHELPEIDEFAMATISTAESIAADCKLTQTEKAEVPGDILLINNDKGIFSHTGVYLGDDKFIHSNIWGVHINRLSEYERKIGRVYRWQE